MYTLFKVHEECLNDKYASKGAWKTMKLQANMNRTESAYVKATVKHGQRRIWRKGADDKDTRENDQTNKALHVATRW